MGNDLLSNYELGLKYYKGIGVKIDYQKAKEFFEKSINDGYASAYHYLGMIYYNGNGVQTNHVKAKECFEKADADNNIFSSYYLGKIYYWGDGVEKNYEKANEYKNKILGKPFFAKQNTEIENFYSVIDFESAIKKYASDLQKKIQNEFKSLYGNEF